MGRHTIAALPALAAGMPASASIRRAWLSKYATYEVLGASLRELLGGLLTAAGRFHNDGREDAYLFAWPQNDKGEYLRPSKGDMLSTMPTAYRVSPRAAQAFMRHSDPRLTANVYTDENPQ